jgi:hypothetical protein
MSEATPPPKSRMAELRERIHAYHGNWVAPLVGRTCNRIVIDKYSPPLVIWFLYDGPAAYIQINSPLRFQNGTDTLRLDPENKRTALGPLLSLIDRTVTHALAGEDGSLLLEFDGGAVIEVDCPEPDSEPWYFHMDEETEAWTLEP